MKAVGGSRGRYFGALDPRARMAFFIASLIVVFRAEQFSTLLICFTVVLVLALVERLNWARLLRPVRYLVWLLPVTFVIHLLFAPDLGALSLKEGWKGVSVPALSYAGFFSCRVALMLLISALLLATVSAPEMVESLRRLCRPLRAVRLPVDELAQVLYLTLSFVPILGDEAAWLREAQIARGIRPGSSLRSRVTGSLPIVIPLFFSSLSRAGRVAVAMESRGYSSGSRRTSHIELRFGLVDGLVSGAMALWVATTF